MLVQLKLTSTGIFSVKSMYLYLLNNQPHFLSKYIWKIKVPLKIKIFMLLLQRRVILTKDNLAKWNWNGDQGCCFCDHNESINHLFFDCHFAKTVWRIVHMTFGLSPPKNIPNLFGNWLKGIPKNDLRNIRVGLCAVLRTIWNIRNDHVFNKQTSTSFLQVIHLVTHWIRTWSYLQPVELRQVMDSGCSTLEMVAKELYNLCGWHIHKRIAV